MQPFSWNTFLLYKDLTISPREWLGGWEPYIRLINRGLGLTKKKRVEVYEEMKLASCTSPTVKRVCIFIGFSNVSAWILLDNAIMLLTRGDGSDPQST